MEFIRSRIETQLMSLTGLSLGQLDLENPKGDPGLFGPGPEPAAAPDDPRRGQAQRAITALGDAQWFGAARPSADGVDVGGAP